jgi:hypothetical protein
LAAVAISAEPISIAKAAKATKYRVPRFVIGCLSFGTGLCRFVWINVSFEICRRSRCHSKEADNPVVNSHLRNCLPARE